jgi:hypothetical protein
MRDDPRVEYLPYMWWMAGVEVNRSACSTRSKRRRGNVSRVLSPSVSLSYARVTLLSTFGVLLELPYTQRKAGQRKGFEKRIRSAANMFAQCKKKALS